jgi:hypothetical protein
LHAARSPRTSEQKDGLGALRALLPEVLAGIKSVPGTETSVGIADLVVNAVKDMECLPNVHGATVAALLRLWDGNWKMDPGMMTVGKNSKLGDGNEQLIFEHFICTWLLPSSPSRTYACLEPVLRTRRCPTYSMNVRQLPYREGRLGAYILRRRGLLRCCCRCSRTTRGLGVKEKLTKFHRLLEGDPEAWMGIREDVMPSLMRSTNKYTVGRRSVARMCPCALYSPLRVLIILSTSAGNIKDNDGQMFNFFITFTNSGNPR